MTDQRGNGGTGTGAVAGAAAISVSGTGGKRRRIDGGNPPRSESSVNSTSSNVAVGRSPLEAIEECSRGDPEWAALHHRQVWFLQVTLLEEAIKE